MSNKNKESKFEPIKPNEKDTEAKETQAPAEEVKPGSGDPERTEQLFGDVKFESEADAESNGPDANRTNQAMRSRGEGGTVNKGPTPYIRKDAPPVPERGNNAQRPDSVRAARPVAGVSQQVVDPDKPSGRLTRDGKMMPHQAERHISELGSGYTGRIDPSTGEPEVHERESDKRQGIHAATDNDY